MNLGTQCGDVHITRGILMMVHNIHVFGCIMYQFGGALFFTFIPMASGNWVVKFHVFD